MDARVGTQRTSGYVVVNTDYFQRWSAGTLNHPETAYARARSYSGSKFMQEDRGSSNIDEALSKSVAQRDQDLLAFFREFMTDGSAGARYAFLRETFNEFTRRYGSWLYADEDEKTSLRRGLWAIYFSIRDHQSEAIVLAAIKTFLKGTFFMTENTNVLEAWVMGVMLREDSDHDQTAQESWDSYID